MAPKIISSKDIFSKNFSSLNLDSNPTLRAKALTKYFSDGGVVSVMDGTKALWPKLVYPSTDRLETQINHLQSLKKKFDEDKKRWEKKLMDESMYHLKHNFFKLSEPVYWKHLLKLITNGEYKYDAGQVNLPAHLISDKRWRPMIQMFVENIEYRKQLVETVQQGLVYKDNKKVGKYANDLRDFRMEISTKKIVFFKKKIEEIDQQVSTLSEMLAWAKEK